MFYKNVKEWPLKLENANTGEIMIISPGQIVDLPETFGNFYSNMLKPVMNQPLTFIPPIDEQIDELVRQEIEDIKKTEAFNSENTEPPKRGRGRPPKAKKG